MTDDASTAAPPTAREGYVAPPTRHKWPTVLGIIAIIFGSFGVLAGVWGMVAPLLMASMFEASGMSSAEVQAQLDVMRSLQGWSIGFSVLSTVLAVVLLVAGVQLVRRRPQGATLCYLWAPSKMVLVVAGVVLGYMAYQSQVDAMASQQNAAATPPEAFAIFNVVIGLAWGWALPVFMLIWFNLGFVKQEVTRWR